MADNQLLGRAFESHRERLTAIARRLLGTSSDAEDAVQEAWLRLHRSESAQIDNLGGWLTTVVSRICLDMLRSRQTRPSLPAQDERPSPDQYAVVAGPIDEALMADSVGDALLLVLDRLGPAERLAFVLHDVFGVPFDQIALTLGRSTDATKQLASRARAKVRGLEPPRAPNRASHEQIVHAFLAASRSGNFEGLIALLHPEVVMRADETAVRMGSPAEVVGAQSVAGVFSGRALEAEAAIVDGSVNVIWRVDGRLRVVWDLTIADGLIARIDMVAMRTALDEMYLERLPG